MPIRHWRDLDVYQESQKAAMDVSGLCKSFPYFEQVELARQLRRSARSVPANIVEGWAKRNSVADFKRYLQNAIGSCHETQHWLDTARDEGYISPEIRKDLENRYNRIGAMLQKLWENWKKLE